jgi:hypothetical protein
MSQQEISDFVEIVRDLHRKWVEESPAEDQIGALTEAEMVLLATKFWKSRFHETNVVFENEVKSLISNKVKNV